MNTLTSPNMVASDSHSELRSLLQIGGFVPLTTLDYPDHLACVIFCQGCAWRCRYCHNPELILPRAKESIAWETILAFLKKRQGLLQGVVFSGGEPTLQKGLATAMQQVKELGFSIGLHSAGIKPSLFKDILPLVDWVGFDVKALPEDHQATSCTKGSGEANWLSLDYLLAHSVDYEVRTTVHWQLFTPEKLKKLANKLAEKGVQHYVIQLARPNQILDPHLTPTVTPSDIASLWQYMNTLFPHFTLRND